MPDLQKDLFFLYRGERGYFRKYPIKIIGCGEDGREESGIPLGVSLIAKDV